MRHFDASVTAAEIVPVEVLRVLRAELGDFLLIGAAARDLVAHVAGGVPLSRATQDLDIAVGVSSYDEYARRVRSLGRRVVAGSAGGWPAGPSTSCPSVRSRPVSTWRTTV